jgi:hypothetical protein
MIDSALSADQLHHDRMAVTRGDRDRLEWFGRKLYSQSDEDGIIAEIFRRIGTTIRVFVEFGAQTGAENNTRLLLEQGWSGLWIEGLPDFAPVVRHVFAERIARGQLKFIEQFVDRDNINGLIGGAGITGEIDFLSVDIDGNDYHVFEAIDVIRPRLVCLEHNHSYPPPVDWVMPYDPTYYWDHTSGVADYGASLVAMARLARQKGYELVGCGLYSPNGFYVRRDLLGEHLHQRCEPSHMFNPLDYDKIVRFPRDPVPPAA